MRDVQVMMLAAGLGTRLWPLTADRGKPAVPFLGRPLIRGMLDWLAAHGAERVVVNTHHRPESIRSALAEPPPGMEVRFSHEADILGTAGCLARALQSGLLEPDRTTLIVNAKLVTDIDLGAAWSAHLDADAAVTLVVRTNRHREAFTTVRVRGDRVLGFGPSRVPEGPRPLLFTGIHLLEPSVLARAEPRFSDTVKDLYPPDIEAGRVLAHVDDEARWDEASTLERYLDLQLAALDDLDAPSSRSDTRIAPDAVVLRSVLGPGVEIEAGARVEDCVLWEGVRVGAGARLRRTVVGADAYVPPGATSVAGVLVRSELADAPPPGAPNVRRSHRLARVELGST